MTSKEKVGVDCNLRHVGRCRAVRKGTYSRNDESEDSDFEMQTSNFEREMFSNKAVTSLNRQSANSTGSTIARYGIPTPMVVD